ncbi:putative O-sialoglycoprotein endopeptidase, partial [Trifolium medium]|nr:putative O-sialoglycoprotein endopeptidase [Trifolium medium]
VVSGGVASNQYVRTRLDTVVKKNGLQLVCPPPWLCTDNGNHVILCFDFNDEG